MTSSDDTRDPDGKDLDTTGHRSFSDTDSDELAPIGGATPRLPKVAADDDDTEGHRYSTGPSTQGEAFPHPGTNPHGDRR